MVYHNYDRLYESYIIFFSFGIIPVSAFGFCSRNRISLLILMSGQIVFALCYLYAGFMSWYLYTERCNSDDHIIYYTFSILLYFTMACGYCMYFSHTFKYYNRIAN